MSARISPLAQTDPLKAAQYLTLRDRLLLSWLAEHYVLTTSQITAALFPSRRIAQRRLIRLTSIGAVSPFRYNPTLADPLLYSIGALPRYGLGVPEVDPGDLRYSLGPLGILLHPTTYHDPDDIHAKAPRTHLERRTRIERSHKRRHLMGINRFFTDLYAHARTHPGSRLTHWWSEQHTTTAFGSRYSVRPDGHGVWQVGDTTIGLFLEHDNDTESVVTVVKKLREYEYLALQGNGPRWPVLLWVPTADRERRLQRALAGTPLAYTVATAVHCRTPAEAIWTPIEDPDTRVRLHELPSGPIEGFHDDAHGGGQHGQ
jgi:hypothetical protein